MVSKSDPVEMAKELYKLKQEILVKDNRIRDLETQVVTLQKMVNSRNSENEDYLREIDKLKSVLQQTFHRNDSGIYEQTGGKENMQVDGLLGESMNVNNALLSVSRSKKQGVSGESAEDDETVEMKHFEKDQSTKHRIRDAIFQNDLLNTLELAQVREMVECMYDKTVAAGCYIIMEGEPGQHLYVSTDCQLEVLKEGKVLRKMESWRSFGELALLYNCNRTASVRAVTNAKLWVLNRRVFQAIMRRTGQQKHDEHLSFLESVPLLKDLHHDKLAKIADALELVKYPGGEHIIREGEIGDTFFIIKNGSVKVTQLIHGQATPLEIRTLTKGDYFGEKALLSDDCRSASVAALPPFVEVLTLDRRSFTKLIGDLAQLKDKNYGDAQRGAQSAGAAKPVVVSTKSIDLLQKQTLPSTHSNDLISKISLSDLKVITTLGVGGFGRVELVTYTADKNHVYALKCLKKKHIVDTKQQEHVLWEKKILSECSSPFICRLYKTFRDDRQVYMLLEACLGGELWTILRNKTQFDDNTTRFVVACVIEAFEYLHNKCIIYRDLKPENLLLEAKGYVKLCDFGFAKTIGQSKKTWTFCGTPEYVAPEVILNKGHDFAADYWSLGVLMFELLTGTPPFVANEPIKIYNIILRGIDNIPFPKVITKNANCLIKKLCRDNASERLGYGKGGIGEIKRNKYFQGFDWKSIHSRDLIPPIIPKLNSLTDTSNFDSFGRDADVPPIENSGWDINF